MTSKAMSPNHREILSARSTITGLQEYLTSTNGILNINGSFSISGSSIPISGATTAIVTAIVDGSGNQITSFGGGVQYTEGDTDVSITGTAMMIETSGNTLRPVQGALADGTYGVVAVIPGHVSTDNSTSTVLAGGGIFTGVWEDVTNIGILVLTVIASHASATDGLSVQFSTDGTNIDNTDEFTIAATTGKTFSFQAAAKYFRVVYTNGATLQTYFRLQSVLKPSYGKPSSHRISDSVSLQDDAELVKAVLAGETTAGGGSFVNVKVNPSGTLQIAGTVAVTQSTSPWIVAGGGTAGSAATGVVTIQGITSMTPVQIGDNGGSISVDWNGTQPVTGSGTATGALRVELPTNGTGVIATVGAVTSITNTVTTTAVGTIADDATTPGAPVMIGGSAKSPDGTDPGSVSAENDVARAITDLNRRLYINDMHPRTINFHSDGSSALTDTSVAADPGDGFQIVVTSIIFSTGAATACNIFFEEGSTKVLGPWYLEAVAGRGVFWKGHKLITASTALTVTTSAAIAQSLDVEYYIQAV